MFYLWENLLISSLFLPPYENESSIRFKRCDARGLLLLGSQVTEELIERTCANDSLNHFLTYMQREKRVAPTVTKSKLKHEISDMRDPRVSLFREIWALIRHQFVLQSFPRTHFSLSGVARMNSEMKSIWLSKALNERFQEEWFTLKWFQGVWPGFMHFRGLWLPSYEEFLRVRHCT